MEDSLVLKQSHVTCNSRQPIERCLATEIYADLGHRVHHPVLKYSFIRSSQKGDMMIYFKPCNYLHGSKEE